MFSKKFLRMFRNSVWDFKIVPSHLRVIHINQRNSMCTSRKRSKSFKNSATKEERTFYSRLQQIGYSYITDPLSAESIASHISHNWKDGYIFEANPGLGILSKALLNTSPRRFRIFEKNSEFLPALQALKKDHINLEIVETDLLSLPLMVTRSMHDGSNDLEIIFNGIQGYSWTDGVPLRVFSVISSKRSIKFLRYLLIAIADKSSIFSYGRSEFIFLMNEKEYKYMTADAKISYATYRWITILYKIFFEIKCLDKFSSKILFPSPAKKSKNVSDEQCLYLMKLTPNPYLFSSVVNGNKLVEFYFFIRHHLAKRSNLVIPALEHWIPFCGPRLIKEGMKVFTKFGDLEPNQLVQLFNQFSSWPEYENSTFHIAMQEYFRKKNFNPSLYEEDLT